MKDIIGINLKKIRTSRNMTLRQLMKASSYTSGHISAIENGLAVPSIKALLILSKYLGVTIADLLKDDTAAANNQEFSSIDYVTYDTLDAVKIIGSNISSIRNKQNKTRYQLAAIANISATTLEGIENGRKAPSISTLRAMAAYFGVDVATFFKRPCRHQFDQVPIVTNVETSTVTPIPKESKVVIKTRFNPLIDVVSVPIVDNNTRKPIDNKYVSISFSEVRALDCCNPPFAVVCKDIGKYQWSNGVDVENDVVVINPAKMAHTKDDLVLAVNKNGNTEVIGTAVIIVKSKDISKH